ncbi:MAG: cytochrome d ubiquinol oxidase subunit II [Peptococcaceae bacterium]|jgi:cytochrome d ubiquinol oxidase subunit II|nr:cytochrome d ubiquinol oxidase subunit II [Peptococcaceae bacterium]
MDLNLIWFLLVGILIVGYSVLDGFDLGVGSLYFFLGKTADEKKVLTHSIDPFWHSNEVWLLTGGGALFAAFPLVYASAFSAFYLPLFLVLFALIARAVAIEYKVKAGERSGLQKALEIAFSLGSFLPALLYGVAMGNVARGIPLDGAQNYTGTFFQLLNPYALVFGLLGLSAFLLQGSAYLGFKTEGDLQKRAQRTALKIWLVFLILYLGATLFSYLSTPQLFANYLQYPILLLIPALSWLLTLLTGHLLRYKPGSKGFLASSAALGLMILTLAVGMFPNLLPATNPNGSLNIYNAASSPLTLKIMLIVVCIGLPFVLLYTVYLYYVFHGKAKADAGGY